MKVQDFFKIAMDRHVDDLFDTCDVDCYPHQINLGGGNKILPNQQIIRNLQLPLWDAESYIIPYENNSIDVIHAYHFLEHIYNPIRMLMECQRVLRLGGVMNILVPHFRSEMAFQDLDHKKYFTSEYLNQTFSNPYYDSSAKSHDWKFHIKFNMIVGIVDRNVGVLSQIVKIQ